MAKKKGENGKKAKSRTQIDKAEKRPVKTKIMSNKIAQTKLIAGIQGKSHAFNQAREAAETTFPNGATLDMGADARDPKVSKQSLLTALLRQPEGATLSHIMKSTGWQAHTVRGVISGVLRKKKSLIVIQERGLHGTAVYKIVEAA